METKSSTDTTVWTAAVDSTGTASISYTVNGGSSTSFVVKGVCYSPCPIGGSNAFGPNIGDWFWDTYSVDDVTITSWQQTWLADLPNIAALNANTVRVYCMLENQLNNAGDGFGTNNFTHAAFLDACYQQGLFVIVGFPLPPWMFQLNGSPDPIGATAWEGNMVATIGALASHPAVLGFTIANEVDNGAVDTYAGGHTQAHWWCKVQYFAQLAKQAAPTKLIGIANHDDIGICANCATNMANCSSIDFWGVNTYQSKSFASVFGGSAGYSTGYALLTGSALKPVILTEFGFPSTSRLSADTCNPQNIVSTATTQAKTAADLTTMLPQVFTTAICAGVCYFEYCDEWWNQSGYQIGPINTPCPGVTGPYAPATISTTTPTLAPPNTYTWYGGPVACGFPNYYWDNMGFGLYSVAVGAGRNPAQPWNLSGNAPALPLDTRNPRQPVIEAVTAGFATST